MANGKKLLKEKDKPRKEKSHPIGWWRKKADTKCQEVGKGLYTSCKVCGRPMSCLHHFFPRSTSANLRYDWDNLIPICQGCHMRHHQAGDPRIHEIIKQRMGGEPWFTKLDAKSRESIRINKEYYRNIISKLNII